MKPWHWVLIAGAGLVVIVIIMKSSSNNQLQSGAVNGNLTAAAGLGGFLASLLGGKKVTAPAGNAYADPGATGFGPTDASSGAAYARAMGGTGYAASESAGSGGGGGYGPTNESQGAAYAAAMRDTGYSTSESAGSGFLGSGGAGGSLSPGQLTAPSFDIGTGGADFSN